jgi:hypothetical protein
MTRKNRIYPSNEEVRRITARIATLSSAEKQLVREMIKRIKPSGVGRAELHGELYKLRKQYAISEADMKGLEDAFFPDEE